MSQSESPEDLHELRKAIAKIKSICDESEGRSQFFPYGGSGYKASVTHYFDSSTEISACAVQPGSVSDLQSIVKVVAETRVPFGVKGGGHSTNPGFSSTKGVQIYLIRFNKITVRPEEKLVSVGAGCLFEELYRALAPHKLNIVGGSGLAGVGVTGWMLGGGYSAKTSQYSLGVDNIESAKIVLPDGSLKEVSATENEDLFFAIKGGGNNFGIITEFTLKAHDQGRYYDFQLTYEEKHYNAVKLALAHFVERTDNRANLEAAFRYHNNPEGIQKQLTVHCVYDGTFPAEDPFKELREIEHTLDNYGDDLPPLGTCPSDTQANAPPAASTTSFYVADARRSWDNETYDLSELPEYLTHPELQGDAAQHSLSMLKSGQLHSITQLVGDGSLIQPISSWDKPPTRPMSGISQFPRGRWGNVMVDKFTLDVISEIEAQSAEAAKDILTHGGRRAVISFWPFTAAMFDRATPSAWPHHRGAPNCPIIVYFTWENKANDAFWVESMQGTLKRLREAVHGLRPNAASLPYFISTSLAEATTVKALYRGHLPRLSVLKERYDPKRVMDLCGGFKIPLPVPGESVSEA